MSEKTEKEILTEKLFNKKENGWNTKTEEERKTIFDYAKGYMDFMNKSKTEREAVITAKAILLPAKTNMFLILLWFCLFWILLSFFCTVFIF